jgi:hypothetical protein
MKPIDLLESGWGFSTLLSGFLKVCWTTSTTVVQKEEKVEISIEDFNGKVYRGSRDFIRIIRSIDRENNNSIGKVSRQ